MNGTGNNPMGYGIRSNMKAPWAKSAGEQISGQDEEDRAKAIEAPVDPLKRPHVRIEGDEAVRVFDLLTKVNGGDLGARCRMWQKLQKDHAPLRTGRWHIAIGLVDLVVYRVDGPSIAESVLAAGSVVEMKEGGSTK